MPTRLRRRQEEVVSGGDLDSVGRWWPREPRPPRRDGCLSLNESVRTERSDHDAASAGTRGGLEQFESGSKRRCARGVSSQTPTLLRLLLLLLVVVIQMPSHTRQCALLARGNVN